MLAQINPQVKDDLPKTEYFAGLGFLEKLFAGLDGEIEIREIAPDGKAVSKFFTDKQLKDYRPPSARNIYFGGYTRKGRRGTKENCLTTGALWADFDNVTLPEVKSRIQQEGIPYPSMLVNSGHGIHAYWLLDKRAGKEAEPVLKSLATRLGSDPQVAEMARVMRVPGTMNVKGEPVPCELIEDNGRVFSLQEFTDILQVSIEPEPAHIRQVDKPACYWPIPEIDNCKMSCISVMAQGVSKGERNFALGKIVSWLKIQGHSKREALNIVGQWNNRNNPPKPRQELIGEFYGFWNGDYKYLGCQFKDRRLQELNQRFCNKAACRYHSQQGIQLLEGEDCIPLDNRIFGIGTFPKMKGLDIAVYSTVALAGEISRKHLADLVNRDLEDRTLRKAIGRLVSQQYLEILPGNARLGIPEKLRIKKSSNFGRGYTLVYNHLVKLYVYKAVTDTEYKLLLLLKSYAYGKDSAFPTSETLAIKLGTSVQNLRKLLQSLEYKCFISREYRRQKNGGNKRFIKLRY